MLQQLILSVAAARGRWLGLFSALLLMPLSAVAGSYYPPPGEWAAAAPQSLGVDAARLAQAVAFAKANENPAPKDQALQQALTFGAREPFDQIIGPMQPRGAANGLVIYRGKLLAQWGDVDRVDMVHSISKTFLTTTTALAWQHGLIGDLQDQAAAYMPSNVDLFHSPHNKTIRWDHLLRQTSDWQGTLWGKPDWADRPEGASPADWPNRPLRTPGSHFKYKSRPSGTADNYVRPNQQSDQLNDASQVFAPDQGYPAEQIRPGLDGILKALQIGSREQINTAEPTAADAGWRKFRLKGSQVEFVTATGRPTLLGNSVTEAGFMDGSSCISCHARAGVAAVYQDGNGKPLQKALANFGALSVFEPSLTDFGYFRSHHGVPNPNWYYSDNNRTPELAVMQTDFVWGFFVNAAPTVQQP